MVSMSTVQLAFRPKGKASAIRYAELARGHVLIYSINIVQGVLLPSLILSVGSTDSGAILCKDCKSRQDAHHLHKWLRQGIEVGRQRVFLFCRDSGNG